MFVLCWNQTHDLMYNKASIRNTGTAPIGRQLFLWSIFKNKELVLALLLHLLGPRILPFDVHERVPVPRLGVLYGVCPVQAVREQFKSVNLLPGGWIREGFGEFVSIRVNCWVGSMLYVDYHVLRTA
jgi:hypothetical protein